ncbi:helix-hairpin-helix domain-containing protein [Thermomonospora umbrina]|uniref:DNA polymerase (Family 10) n=1 Tax=Thermomonospora umbrina TaxID=111806 RepID=A0A3D9SXD6_9ACTN|nr:helix-hairpin-helix domain-containing protein [Thermomonospora umbrina]REE98713.1 DNA polymerase (family 10) [Thermomonospora umbrina]
MGATEDEVAALLLEYADLFAMNGGDGIRVRSYKKAAASIAAFPGDLSAVDVRTVPDVGEAIAKKVEEALERGTFRQLEDLRGRIPAGARTLLAIPGLGPKRALQLHTDLGVDSPQALGEAIAEGRLDGLKGFGPKTRQSLLEGVASITAG